MPEQKVTFVVISRRTRSTPDVEEVVHDEYDSIQTAREFANELVEYHGLYNARVNNSKGVTVYDARANGVRYNRKLGGKRKRGG